MNFMKWILSFLFIFSFALTPAWVSAAGSNKNQGLFTSVNGKVSIKSKSGATRQAKKDSTVLEGEKISTDVDSSASLKFFDGSELKISPKTQFFLSKLQKKEGEDKVLKFKLLFGKLLAKVKKLASSQSAFEISGGGVVCGVRGTEFSMNYNPDTGKVDVVVYDGTVWTDANGVTHTFHGGETGNFTNGHMDNDGNQGNGNSQGGNNFNPFFGVNGNQQDNFGSLTDPTDGTNGVAGQTGDDNLQGLGAHTAILQLGYPEQ